MVDITNTVINLTNKQVKALAEQIKEEMQAIIADGHIKTGAAYNSIQINYNNAGMSGASFTTGASGAMRGGFLTSVFIGSHELSAYYLDNGNGGRRRKIRPHHKRSDGTNRPPMLGEYPSGIPEYGWRPYVHGYKGIHFCKEVANRHR